jgi:TPR repeat protein
LQRDYVVAIRYLRRASDAATESDTESHEAPFLLGQLLGDIHPNVRIPPETLLLDPPGALEQFKRAAEMGHPQAMFELAYAYEYACFGLQFPEPDLSIEWYRRAAQLGNAEAMMGLSGWYLTGLEGVLQPDESAAFECKWG